MYTAEASAATAKVRSVESVPNWRVQAKPAVLSPKPIAGIGIIAAKIPITHTAANLAPRDSCAAWMRRGPDAREARSATPPIESTNPSTCADAPDNDEVAGEHLNASANRILGSRK